MIRFPEVQCVRHFDCISAFELRLSPQSSISQEIHAFHLPRSRSYDTLFSPRTHANDASPTLSRFSEENTLVATTSDNDARSSGRNNRCKPVVPGTIYDDTAFDPAASSSACSSQQDAAYQTISGSTLHNFMHVQDQKCADSFMLGNTDRERSFPPAVGSVAEGTRYVDSQGNVGPCREPRRKSDRATHNYIWIEESPHIWIEERSPETPSRERLEQMRISLSQRSTYFDDHNRSSLLSPSQSSDGRGVTFTGTNLAETWVAVEKEVARRWTIWFAGSSDV
ncbi:hypothetical protein CYMTET_4627 [Cymbomonas tetramitiformis]|uniref:Uncharacterized protein n=1 Tax=Cymbomonas tetramitiformis TaxID=36881 RepID=A0AAE0H131_9CHLO|nr:hypothetical protein CYMTET_4627 [Cymbomonas tetramitiformis]